MDWLKIVPKRNELSMMKKAKETTMAMDVEKMKWLLKQIEVLCAVCEIRFRYNGWIFMCICIQFVWLVGVHGCMEWMNALN